MNICAIHEAICERIDTLAALEQPGPVDLGSPEDNLSDQDRLFRELRALRFVRDHIEPLL